MREAGLPMAFGSDLLGGLHRHQSMEFEILARVLPAAEIIASSTIVGAKLCGMEGQIGVIAPNAHADLLVVDGDPLGDVSLLAEGRRAHAGDHEGRSVLQEHVAVSRGRLRQAGPIAYDVNPPVRRSPAEV